MNKKYQNKDWLSNKYINEGWSQCNIADYCNVSQSTILKWMQRFSIKSRDLKEAQLGKRNGSWIDSPIKDYANLYREYIVHNKSFRDIAKENQVSLRTVARWINFFSIKKTDDSIKQCRSEKTKGEKNCRWTGKSICPNCGRTKTHQSTKCQICYFNFLRQNPKYTDKTCITHILRSYTKKHWNQQILERDNYTCKECGNSKNLHVHHIIPFTVIRDQLLIENHSLDIKDNEQKSKLISICKQDSRLNDINNGITLCKSCHQQEHAYIKSIEIDNLYVYSAEIISIIDTDTIKVDIDLGFDIHKQETLRLYGVNAPEIKGKNKELVKKAKITKKIMEEVYQPGRQIKIKTFKPGKYGRYLALLIIDQQMINHKLVKHKAAQEKYY